MYLTNAVKHFKFEERGKGRIHKTPTKGEVDACVRGSTPRSSSCGRRR